MSMAIALWIAARIRGSRIVFNVQDLHPDAAIALGLVRGSLLIRFLRRVERWAYSRADALAVICEGFREHCVSRGADSSRVVVIPNWIDLDEVVPLRGPSKFRTELGISPSDFVVLYAGTIGLVSGAGIVVDVARRLRSFPDVKFVFVGDGPLLGELSRVAAEGALTGVKFLPFQDRALLSEVQGLADVSLVTLLAGHGRTSVPSKMLGYMAAARAIVASVDANSETARMVAESGCGIVVPPEDPEALAAGILQLREDRRATGLMGMSGREYLGREMGKQVAMSRYQRLFEAQGVAFVQQ
jgi:colanic acid biosynthesis glycosyl transferase WcaI